MDDPDPLPEGFYLDPKRRCQFYGLERSQGETGLAWAIFYQALTDGVNARFLRLIAHFYELRVPERFFERPPAERVKIYPLPMTFDRKPSQRGERRCRILLSWMDAVAIGRHHLRSHDVAV